jgi:hypothetical protein
MERDDEPEWQPDSPLIGWSLDWANPKKFECGQAPPADTKRGALPSASFMQWACLRRNGVTLLSR